MALFKTPAARRFTATLAAAATALALMTLAAVPARAGSDRDDFARAAAALAGISINDTTSRNRKAFGHDNQPRHRQFTATLLPTYCAVSVRGHRQIEVVYPARCLRRAGIDRRLPQRCEVELRGRGHARTAYEENCLLQSGFRAQGRRH